jgi:broad specificity phosphatase PhoE
MVLQLPVVREAPSVPEGTVYFVRHGLVHNPTRIMYGWLPRFRLTGEGVRQAEAAGQYLADKGAALVLSSPLLRALQTSRIISSYMPGVRIRRSRLLIEGALAKEWQGTYWAELSHKYPEQHRIWQESAGSMQLGETLAAMARRVQAAMALALRLTSGAPAICVSHRDPIAAFRLAVEGRSFDELHVTECNTASITAVSSNGGHLRILDYVQPYEAVAPA